MRAAWYERQGPPSGRLVVGEMPTPQPGRGVVRIRVTPTGVDPGDVKKRQDAFDIGMAHRTYEVCLNESRDLRWQLLSTPSFQENRHEST